MPSKKPIRGSNAGNGRGQRRKTVAREAVTAPPRIVARRVILHGPPSKVPHLRIRGRLAKLPIGRGSNNNNTRKSNSGSGSAVGATPAKFVGSSGPRPGAIGTECWDCGIGTSEFPAGLSGSRAGSGCAFRSFASSDPRHRTFARRTGVGASGSTPTGTATRKLPRRSGHWRKPPRCCRTSPNGLSTTPRSGRSGSGAAMQQWGRQFVPLRRLRGWCRAPLPWPATLWGRSPSQPSYWGR